MNLEELVKELMSSDDELAVIKLLKDNSVLFKGNKEDTEDSNEYTQSTPSTDNESDKYKELEDKFNDLTTKYDSLVEDYKKSFYSSVDGSSEDVTTTPTVKVGHIEEPAPKPTEEELQAKILEI